MATLGKRHLFRSGSRFFRISEELGRRRRRLRRFTMLSLSRILIASLALFSVFVAGCQLDIDAAYHDFVCEEESCFTCAEGVCFTYYCAEDHQCPSGRICSDQKLCIEAIEEGSTELESPQCDRDTPCSGGGTCIEGGLCLGSSSNQPDEPSSSGTQAKVEASAEEANASAEASAPGTNRGVSSEPDGADAAGATPSLPQHPNASCVVNDDCGFTGICLDGGCYFQCDAIGACPPDQRCESGQCLPTDSPEVVCTFNGECGPQRVCIEGQCFSTCAESIDCSEQMICDAGLCLADTSPVIQCAGSGTCAEGEGCFDGKCLELCDTERPCADAGICQFGYCHQKVTCTLSEQCASTQACLDGQCQ